MRKVVGLRGEIGGGRAKRENFTPEGLQAGDEIRRELGYRGEEADIVERGQSCCRAGGLTAGEVTSGAEFPRKVGEEALDMLTGLLHLSSPTTAGTAEND